MLNIDIWAFAALWLFMHITQLFLMRVGRAGTSLPFSSIIIVFVPKLEHITIDVPSTFFAQSGVTCARNDKLIAKKAI